MDTNCIKYLCIMEKTRPNIRHVEVSEIERFIANVGERPFRVKQIVEWSKLYAIQNNKKFIRLDTVGENQKLIQHYTSFGFDFLGFYQLTNTAGLPKHYHNATVSLFELSV